MVTEVNLSQFSGSFEDFKIIVQSKQTVVVNVWADWAKPCSQVNDVISELAKEHRMITFVNLEAEKHEEVSSELDIESVPTVIIFQNGTLKDKIEGADISKIVKAVKSAANSPVQIEKKNDINTRLKELINQEPVMKVQFGYFNILNDNEVREGLKLYSDWATYPQLYVNGDLVGGLDIVKEMNASGELDDILPRVESLNERLKKLINQKEIMIFIKGSPTAPKCGFTRQLIQLFRDNNVNDFGYFDILSDENVRQGLKTYSDWQTYPQIYVKGEFVGGLDIFRDMLANGEWNILLNKN
ncbi:Monothiol glutaredoxin-related domain-containing protein [Rozella allomycis CSF55]|uniref:Monothiol glutaredoxin-related domain-containing protein n=1 Tax=Rozella allomycis (strain CSF55) TaxID=988480 RepID=A0A075AUP4_ROZAC|nr:Monothiol glutaredoxin-related domain-containing protein [Rozella allomycis CSF55]|eukprot:EPZ32244.1 Monothiol glutaredoxin-related domain-containing protein [Rozella allomycis CSF55]